MARVPILVTHRCPACGWTWTNPAYVQEGDEINCECGADFVGVLVDGKVKLTSYQPPTGASSGAAWHGYRR